MKTIDKTLNKSRSSIPYFNPNETSPQAQKIKMDNKIFEEYEKVKKEALNNLISQDNEDEKYDEMTIECFSVEKQQNLIKKYFQSKNNFHHIDVDEEPYIYPATDRINYVEDNYYVPNIKNKISKDLTTRDFSFFKYPNSIDRNTHIFLNSKKKKFQLKKDNKIKIDAIKKKNLIYQYNGYEFDDFFSYKYDKYDKVQISDLKIKNIILKIEPLKTVPNREQKIRKASISQVDERVKRFVTTVN